MSLQCWKQARSQALGRKHRISKPIFNWMPWMHQATPLQLLPLLPLEPLPWQLGVMLAVAVAAVAELARLLLAEVAQDTPAVTQALQTERAR